MRLNTKSFNTTKQTLKSKKSEKSIGSIPKFYFYKGDIESDKKPKDNKNEIIPSTDKKNEEEEIPGFYFYKGKVESPGKKLKTPKNELSPLKEIGDKLNKKESEDPEYYEYNDSATKKYFNDKEDTDKNLRQKFNDGKGKIIFN